jgi:26S proteasome regulatory subunit T3
MADAMVENPANTVPPHKKSSLPAIPSIENFEGVSTEAGDDYAALKKLQRQLEYIQLQEEYIKDEQRFVLLPKRGQNRCRS